VQATRSQVPPAFAQDASARWKDTKNPITNITAAIVIPVSSRAGVSATQKRVTQLAIIRRRNYWLPEK
jgi:hypothetical protein